MTTTAPRRLPAFFKAKYKGKEIGSWCIELRGKKINLHTKDVEEARRRRVLAVEKGVRTFKSDSVEGTAAQVAAAVDGVGTAAGEAAVVETGPAAPNAAPPPASTGAAGPVAAAVNAAAAPPAAAAAAPAPAPAPPGPTTGPELADVVAAAAGGAGQDPGAAGVQTKIDPELVTMLLDQAADGLVVLQLTLQKWLIAKTVKVVASPVQASNKSLADGKRLHTLWMRALVPPDLNLPPWAGAIFVVGFGTVGEQLKDAPPIEPTEGEPSSGPASSATPAAA